MRRATLLLCIVATLGTTACSDRTARGAVEALGEGNLERAREIYAGGIDPDEMVSGRTALHMSACQASTETIELLLDAGADPNLPSRRRLTPLIYAARCGNTPVAALLLEAGADPNLAAPGDETPLSAAREAGEEELVQLLLEEGAEPSQAKAAGRRKATGY